MHIRQEREQDYPEIYRLVKEAFATAEHAGGNEQDLVEALRKGTAYLPELALVAEEEGVLAGHILLTRASVGGAPVMALAPLSVRPEFQRRGVGTALMEKAHEIARARGEDYVLVLTTTPGWATVRRRNWESPSPRASPPPASWPCGCGRTPAPSAARWPTPRSSDCDLTDASSRGNLSLSRFLTPDNKRSVTPQWSLKPCTPLAPSGPASGSCLNTA